MGEAEKGGATVWGRGLEGGRGQVGVSASLGCGGDLVNGGLKWGGGGEKGKNGLMGVGEWGWGDPNGAVLGIFGGILCRFGARCDFCGARRDTWRRFPFKTAVSPLRRRGAFRRHRPFKNGRRPHLRRCRFKGGGASPL